MIIIFLKYSFKSLFLYKLQRKIIDTELIIISDNAGPVIKASGKKIIKSSDNLINAPFMIFINFY